MPKHLLFCFVLIISIIILGFNTNHTSSIEQSNVYLNINDKDSIIKMVYLEEIQDEFFDKNFLSKSKSENEKLDVSLYLLKPKIYRISSFKPQSKPTLIYVSPGDSLTYKLDNNNTIVFEGKNAAQYNFFNELNNLGVNYNQNKEIWSYKEDTELNYRKKLFFLEQYIKNKKVTTAFSNKIKEVLKFQYVNKLLNSNLIPKEIKYNHSKYLNGINIKMFNRNDQQNNLYFNLALINFLYYQTSKNDILTSYSKENLEYQLDIIDKNLTGNVKQFAITKIIFEYENHLDKDNLNNLITKIDVNLPKIKEKKYIEVLKKIKQRLINLNLKLPNEVLKSCLIDPNGNKITFEEVLKQKGNTVKIIDFWASWCAPCIEEIKKSYDYRNKLVSENNVNVLYFSIDSDIEKWKAKMKNLEKFGMNKNQYLINSDSNNYLVKYFNVNSIPQYLILDFENKIFLFNAPSPNDSIEYNKIIDKANTHK